MAFAIHVVEHVEAGRILAAFAAVALAADAIHRHRQHLVGLAREGAKAHAAGAEAPADALDALYLINRQRRGGLSQLEQITQGRDRPVFEQGLVGGEVVVAGACRHGGMEGLGHLRAVEVVFTAGAVLHEAHELELGAVEFGVGFGVKGERFASEIGQAQTRHPAGGAGEGQGDQIGADADRLEDLGAVVAGQQRDANLGEDLAKAILQGLAYVGLGRIGREIRKFAPLDQRAGLGVGQPMAGGFPGQPGAHGAGPVADQAGQMMGAPALGGIDHDRALQPQAQAQQVMVNRPDRQEGGDVGGASADPATAAVGEHQDATAAAHCGFGPGT